VSTCMPANRIELALSKGHRYSIEKDGRIVGGGSTTQSANVNAGVTGGAGGFDGQKLKA
jgi:hypothetical protein